MSRVVVTTYKVKTRFSALIVAAAIGVHPVHASDVTAGAVLKDMPSGEFVAFVTGIVEGMAYARFRKDSLAAGQKVETGMQCIRTWFHSDPKIIVTVQDTFRKYADYAPWVVLGVMAKKECGE